MKFVTPTEVQAKAIPLALRGHNVVAQSKTGTGKTLAFTAPIIDKIDPSIRAVQAVVLVPTRELCLQDAETMRALGRPFKINVLEIYGGVEYGKQKDGLSYGEIGIVVATPGRLIDLVQQNYLDFSTVRTIVLDEADRMLDMGFFPDIEFLFSKMPRDHVQILLFSATIFQEILESIHAITHGKHTIVRIGKNEDEFVVDEIEQVKYVVLDRNHKYNMLKKIMHEEKPQHCLIFTNTISGVEFLEKRLHEDFRFPILAMTGNVSQKRRERIINDFKAHKIHHLIATDVASRGLDIPNITHVIVYDVPQYAENYIHRVGRTGRLSQDDGTIRRGKAIMICAQNELMSVARIEELIRKEIKTIRAPGVSADGSAAGNAAQQGWRTATRVPHSIGDADAEGDEDDEYSGYNYQPRNPFRY
ncbi:MAG: DEAD/DEAH box helicase [Candidatus Lokiarchaeota archaeon]|nr:DEAD/DEAH box helicase [Candidatus Lokiarchaeota archaeon]